MSSLTRVVSFFPQFLLGVVLCILVSTGRTTPSNSRVGAVTLDWENHILTIYHPDIPGGKIETWYLEAYCRAGSTDRAWGETVIGHKTVLLSKNPEGTILKLRCTLSDGVTVEHLIRAVADGVAIELVARNNGTKPSDAHWAQPCTRVGNFTGTGETSTDDKYAYLKKSFIFQNEDEEPDFMPTAHWSEKARYLPGQVWCPTHVPRTDVNPRPLHPQAPSLGLIGCVSKDRKWILAMAWEPYQELFQGVIRCLHSDFRIGGLKPGEVKKIRGRFYIMPNDFPALVARYKEEFPEAQKSGQPTRD